MLVVGERVGAGMPRWEACQRGGTAMSQEIAYEKTGTPLPKQQVRLD
ncbi:MAG: hypothetical protein DVB23_001561 [Verrucomicrobia bacterium]|nr:MAG: hypothetical protein DVB23_001561 [Verrucomicrobiota bacterium]